MSKLVFRYRFDDGDDFGWLEMEVATDAFSGRSGFWVQWQDVKEFGESLSTYPLNPDAPIRDSWGYEMQEGNDLMLSVEIAPDNPRGDLRVRVELADYSEPAERLRTSFVTNYPDLESFRIGIANLMDRQSDEAVLTGR